MSNTQININLSFPKAGVIFVINGNNPSFEITVTDSAGKNQSLKRISIRYLGYCWARTL